MASTEISAINTKCPIVVLRQFIDNNKVVFYGHACKRENVGYLNNAFFFITPTAYGLWLCFIHFMGRKVIR